MNIKILDKYIFSQVFWATLVCILLFSIIWIAPEILLRTVQRVLDGTYTTQQGISAILCEIPKILGNALPIGIFLGTLFTFDKLSKDSEITILRATGISFYRIIGAALFLGVIIAVFSFFIRDRMIPYASMKYDVVKQVVMSTHFVFPVKRDSGKMDKIIIVPEFTNYKITDVVVLNFADEADKKGNSVLKNILLSDFVRYDNDKWIINKALTYDISTDGIFTKTGEAEKILILEGQRAVHAYDLMKFALKRDRDMTNFEIKKYINLLKQESMDDEYRFMLNKYLQRFSQSIITVLFVVFGALLGFSKPREQRLIGFTIAVLTVFLYYITMPFLDMLAEKGVLHPIITAFLSVFIMLYVCIDLKKRKDL